MKIQATPRLYKKVRNNQREDMGQVFDDETGKKVFTGTIEECEEYVSNVFDYYVMNDFDTGLMIYIINAD